MARPSTALWDVGAYEFSLTNPMPTPNPTPVPTPGPSPTPTSTDTTPPTTTILNPVNGELVP